MRVRSMRAPYSLRSSSSSSAKLRSRTRCTASRSLAALHRRLIDQKRIAEPHLRGRCPRAAGAGWRCHARRSAGRGSCSRCASRRCHARTPPAAPAPFDAACVRPVQAHGHVALAHGVDPVEVGELAVGLAVNLRIGIDFEPGLLRARQCRCDRVGGGWQHAGQRAVVGLRRHDRQRPQAPRRANHSPCPRPAPRLLYLIHVMSMTVGGYDECARSDDASITPRPPHPGDKASTCRRSVIVPPITALAPPTRKGMGLRTARRRRPCAARSVRRASPARHGSATWLRPWALAK